jgi:hypothetical protein
MHPSSPRRRRGGLALAALVLLVLPGAVGAQDKFAAEFLKIGVGARPLAMGGAFVSVADDATAPYWNPAGLVQMTQREVMLMHASQFGGAVRHNFLDVVFPLGGDKPSAVALSVIYLSVDDIKVTTDALIGTDPDGNPILDETRIRSESAYDLGVLLSYGKAFSPKVSWGVNLKLIRQSLVDAGASFGVGADLAFLWRPTDRITAGARLADVTTTQIYWDSGNREVVGRSLTLGGSTLIPVEFLQGSLRPALDVVLAFEEIESAQFGSGSISGDVLLGGEYWFRQVVALRAGSDAGDFTAGAGVRYKGFSVDYAYLGHEELDATHRVSAAYRF